MSVSHGYSTIGGIEGDCEEKIKKEKVSHQLGKLMGYHYCRMVQTRHYDQRPFDEIVCGAIIANGGVKNRQKKGAKRLR